MIGYKKCVDELCNRRDSTELCTVMIAPGTHKRKQISGQFGTLMLRLLIVLLSLGIT